MLTAKLSVCSPPQGQNGARPPTYQQAGRDKELEANREVGMYDGAYQSDFDRIKHKPGGRFAPSRPEEKGRFLSRKEGAIVAFMNKMLEG